jgi:hypothetical protein
MVLTGQFKRACAVGLLGALIASVGVFSISRARADNGDDARASLKAMSDYASASGGGNCVQVTDFYGQLVTQCH